MPPSDKSLSHRAALFGAMSDTPITIRNYLQAQDTESTLGALHALGAGVERRGADVVVRGVGLHAPLGVTNGLLDVGNSGTLLRLLPGWLAGQPGGVWTLDGDESIRRRPVDRVVAPLTRMGADVEAREGRLTPLTVRGRELRGIDHELPVASAQVKSCILIAGMLAAGETTVREPHPSRDHTERLMLRSAVAFEREDGLLRVCQVDELDLDEELVVPGDPSSAAPIVAAAMLVPDSRIVVSGVCLNWTRTGFFRIARRMGAVIVGDLEEPGAEGPEEPVGELDVASVPLVGTTVEPDEVPLAIDELPLVALLGCYAEGETVVRGAGELRVKESDRIAGVVDGLRALGGDVEPTGDGFVVRPTGGLRGGTLDARGDHRLAMLGAVAGLASRDGVEVVGMDAAAVSYPRFADDLRRLLAA